jgi:hypothetical protein
LRIRNERLSIAKGIIKMKRSIPTILFIVLVGLTALVFAGEVEEYFKSKGLHVADLSEEDGKSESGNMVIVSLGLAGFTF